MMSGILTLNLLLLIPLATSVLTGLDTSLVNGIQILPAWQIYFHHPRGVFLGLINCATAIGVLVSLPFTSLASDSLGRRKTLILGSVFMLGGGILQVLSKNSGMLVGARVTIGLGLAFATNAAPLLITELAYPTQRAKLSSAFNTLWYVGSIISAWICYGTYRADGNSPSAWRIPTIVQCVIPSIQLVLIWFLPESPRWLVSKGRDNEAISILARYRTNISNEQDPLVLFEMAQIRHALEMEKEGGETSWFTMVSTPGNRKRTMILIALGVFSQWSGNGLVIYYLHLILDAAGITSPNTQNAINGGLQIFNLFAAVVGALLVDKLGRRSLFIISNIGMLLTFAAWTISTALFNVLKDEELKQGAAKAAIPFMFLFLFFYDVAYTPLIFSYILEILPFNIRARGFSILVATSSVGAALNVLTNPWALQKIGWKYYLVYCAALLMELLFVYKFIVETKGRTLEETAALFDGGLTQPNIIPGGRDSASTTVSIAQQIRMLYDEIEEDLEQRINLCDLHELKRSETMSTMDDVKVEMSTIDDVKAEL